MIPDYRPMFGLMATCLISLLSPPLVSLSGLILGLFFLFLIAKNQGFYD